MVIFDLEKWVPLKEGCSGDWTKVIMLNQQVTWRPFTWKTSGVRRCLRQQAVMFRLSFLLTETISGSAPWGFNGGLISRLHKSSVVELQFVSTYAFIFPMADHPVVSLCLRKSAAARVLKEAYRNFWHQQTDPVETVAPLPPSASQRCLWGYTHRRCERSWGNSTKGLVRELNSRPLVADVRITLLDQRGSWRCCPDVATKSFILNIKARKICCFWPL